MRRAIVTGAASGIGEATARMLVRRDVAVVGFDLHCDAEESEGREYPLLRVDVSDASSVDRGVGEAVSILGGLDTLICAAGVTARGTAEETTPEAWDRMLGANAKGPFLCARAAIPHLRGGEAPSIVNVGSQFGLIAAPGYVAYCASKAALIHLTRALAVDHGPEGIRVNAICPGPVDTPMSRAHIDASASPDIERINMTARTLSGRFADPDELAEAIVFLASPAASAVYGANLIADAGYSIH